MGGKARLLLPHTMAMNFLTFPTYVSSGQLDMAEFTKGMQELQICDLTPKALQHLFRYFGKSIAVISLVA